MNSLDGITAHKQLLFNCNVNNFAPVVFPFDWFQQSQILGVVLFTYVENFLRGLSNKREHAGDAEDAYCYVGKDEDIRVRKLNVSC